LRRAAAAGFLVATAVAYASEPASVASSFSADLVHRRLVERADNGAQLVTESGELLRVDGVARFSLARGGALRASAALAAGTLDYAGQTQAGVPLATDSSHRDIELGLAWRPFAPAAWGEGWLTLAALQQRRQIASTPQAQGLRETTALLLPGLRWSRPFDAGGWRWEPSVALRASVWQRLDVDSGGTFDAVRLEGGRRRELVLALQGGRAGSPWHWGLTWSRARQDASAPQPLYRAGAPAGFVREPRVEIDDVSLRVTRDF
jgi:hypothetical protein